MPKASKQPTGSPKFICAPCRADGATTEGPLVWPSENYRQNPRITSSGRVLMVGACERGHLSARIVAVGDYAEITTVPNIWSGLVLGAALKAGFEAGRAKVLQDRDAAMHRLSVAGLSRKEIANAYGVSVYTVNEAIARGRAAAEGEAEAEAEKSAKEQMMDLIRAAAARR